MSNRLITAIFESAALGPTERLIMLALADHADDQGRCFPSIERLCKRTGLSERAVQTNIRALQKAGYLRVSGGGGKRKTNVYTVCPNPAAATVNEPTKPRSTCAVSDPKPRSTCAVSDPKPRSTCAHTPHLLRSNPAADAPEPKRTPIEPSAQSRAQAREAAALPGENKPGAVPEPRPGAVPDDTTRERLLAAMGLGPDGVAGPASFLGTMADMAEARGWAAMGLSLDAQCRVIGDVCRRQRSKQPDWQPRRFGYFTAAMQDVVTPKTGPAAAPADVDRKRSQWKRMAGMA